MGSSHEVPQGRKLVRRRWWRKSAEQRHGFVEPIYAVMQFALEPEIISIESPLTRLLRRDTRTRYPLGPRPQELVCSSAVRRPSGISFLRHRGYGSRPRMGCEGHDVATIDMVGSNVPRTWHVRSSTRRNNKVYFRVYRVDDFDGEVAQRRCTFIYTFQVARSSGYRRTLGSPFWGNNPQGTMVHLVASSSLPLRRCHGVGRVAAGEFETAAKPPRMLVWSKSGDQEAIGPF
ncbi:hypothetical protein C8F04DRAFT_345416 [Mycena alexandri]|uniref:Uncharacterized protein n=1 Tax=Mycena alexandri TaxID=1745969 RepID=A0AAD6TK53_9AGAR|nr:hypothetical protein C8F04DRAFT_345416 [Mycena alexandri]